MQPPAETSVSLYRRLLGLSLPHWRMFVVAALGMALYAGTDTAFAWLVNNLLKAVSPDRSGAMQYASVRGWIPLAILALFSVRGIGEFASTYGLGWVGRMVIATLRARVFDKFMCLPARFFDRSSTAELLSRLTFNIEQIAESTSSVVTVMVREMLTAVGLVGYMVYLSPPLAAVVFLAVPVVVTLNRTLARLFRRYSSRIQQSMGDVMRVTQEALQNQRVIRIFEARTYENQRFAAANDLNRRMHMRLIVTRSIGDAVGAIVAAAGLAAVSTFAASDTVREAMDLGDFAGFITALLMLMRPLRNIIGINATIQKGLAAGESVFGLLDQPDEADSGVEQVVRAQGRVEFCGVQFSYDNSKGAVLRDIDLVVPAGHKIAIVGRSGSGKTTLVNMLPRFYDADAGEILLDGRLLQSYSLAALRSQISLVSQEVALFNDTVANNIAYGALHGAPRADIEKAARAAHLEDLLAQLPQGLDTMIGDRGLLLSGGQRQRIAIARALLKDAPILILDEATSALDSESERHIQAALDELMANRTTFIIAHRLSTVEHADSIIVMAAGRIVERGTHQQLLAANGQYAVLHRLQFRDE